MIVIGSHAAQAGGFLPAWRKGQKISRDIDLVCRASELSLIEHHYGAPVVDGSLFIGTDNFEVNVLPDEIVDLMEADAGAPVLLWQGVRAMPVLMATPEVIWATLYFTAGCVVKWFDKSFRDLFAYEDLVQARGLLSEDHWRISRFYREMMLGKIRVHFGA